MKRIFLATIAAAFTLCMQAQNALKTTFSSPDGILKVMIQAEGNDVKYTIYEGELTDGNIYALDNNIALNIEGIKEGKYTISTPKLIKEHFDAPNYKQASFDSEYNTVTVKNKNGVNIEFRAYNSGVAYRFFTTSTKKEWKVLNEVAEFNFGKDRTAYISYSTNPSKPKAMAFQATYDVAPLSQTKNLEAFLPATVDCGKAKVTILETDVENYPGIFLLPGTKSNSSLRADFAKHPKAFDFYPWRVQKYVTETEDFIAKGTGNRTFPWRILAITHDDKEMPTNTLAYELASPSRIKGDTSWIKPGKVAWDWWNDWGLSGVDFKAGINQQTYQYYIDFAAKNKLEYIILDEGWYDPKSGDMLTVIPDLNLPALVEYGKRKNVGIILWTVFNVLDAQLEEACEKFAAMGIKGFKVDFLDRYDQEAVAMIYRIAEKCAQNQLILDYHGIFAPQGINRTYPNVINFEAVFGMEETKWTLRAKVQKDGKTIDEPEKDMPLYDVTFPFIRGMAGYVDFTPGGFRNATKDDFQPIYNNPMTMGTRCHQMAHYIIHDSPLTMLADNPTTYEKEPECTDFIASLPTVYERMTVLDGKMGEYIITARQQGGDWYVAGETNWEARDVDIDVSFLPAGTYEVTAFFDGKNAEKVASDYEVMKQTVTIPYPIHEKITVHMASGGGFAAKIIKK
ncbi:MAG: glycoside hydrolase family 97 catalytic domain-containing protein [Bacteroidaceae bacterium]|nr:glycoside hydrolase family 97 catalytic domain-containing protein [Bacteroidaceae bacterium]